MAVANPKENELALLENATTELKHRRLTLYGEPVHLLVGKLPQASEAGGRNK